MKKILIMTGSMNVGGIEKALVEMLKIIPYDMYDVDLLLEEPEGLYMSEIPKQVHMVYNPTIANCLYKSRKMQIIELFSKKRIFAILRLLYESALFSITKNYCRYYSWQCSRMDKTVKIYDVAIAYSNPFRFPGHYIVKNVEANRKILWNHTDLLYDKINHTGFEQFYKDIDLVVNVSKGALDSCVELLPTMKDRMTVFYNVINSDEIVKKSKEFDIEKNVDVPVFLTVGRLSPEKGQDRIPDIAKRLKQSGVEFVWYVVGGGKLFDEIKAKIQKYDLSKNVILTGNQENPYPYMRECDIYVQTSWQEGFPMVIGEVLTFGKPCVVTNVGGTIEYFNNQNPVEIAKVNSNECIADAIEKMVCDKEHYLMIKNSKLELPIINYQKDFIKLLG